MVRTIGLASILADHNLPDGPITYGPDSIVLSKSQQKRSRYVYRDINLALPLEFFTTQLASSRALLRTPLTSYSRITYTSRVFTCSYLYPTHITKWTLSHNTSPNPSRFKALSTWTRLPRANTTALSHRFLLSISAPPYSKACCDPYSLLARR